MAQVCSATDVLLGELMAEATVELSGGAFVAAVTRNSAERFGLSKGDGAPGDDVVALVKATEAIAGESGPHLRGLDECDTANGPLGNKRPRRGVFSGTTGPTRARRQKETT